MANTGSLFFGILLIAATHTRAQEFSEVLDKCRDHTGACVSIPVACLVNEDAGACEAVAYVTVSNDTITNFVVASNRTGRGYIALGFSDDADMGSEAALDCIRDDTGATAIKPAYNTNVNNILSDLATIEGLTDKTNATETSHACEFEIDTGIKLDPYNIDYNGSYYLVLAYGELDDNLKPKETDKVVVSSKPFTLNIDSGATSISSLIGVIITFSIISKLLQ